MITTCDQELNIGYFTVLIGVFQPSVSTECYLECFFKLALLEENVGFSEFNLTVHFSIGINIQNDSGFIEKFFRFLTMTFFSAAIAHLEQDAETIRVSSYLRGF
ncbi:MAG: hypothetical protein ACYSUX_08050 [Planctomycetota bacterium]